MTRVVARIAAGLAVLSLATAAVAAPQKGKKEEKAPQCPSCKMDLTMKKDKTHTVAVKIKGKTYYCCAKCPMNKKPPKAKS